MGPLEIGSMSEMKRPGGAWHWDMRTTDPQVLGIQRFVSSYTECLLLLSTFIHVSQARRLPATRERDPEDSSASH